MGKASVVKVAIIGPECTGKSALSSFLAAQYQTAWVPEFARTYLEALPRPYKYEDLVSIAEGQLNLEDEKTAKANRILFCDTNLYVIKVWSQFKFGKLDERIKRMMDQRHYDLYLLTYVDIPWQADPQREHPTRREELYSIYLDEMKAQATPFVEVSGTGAQRERVAMDAVDKLLTKA